VLILREFCQIFAVHRHGLRKKGSRTPSAAHRPWLYESCHSWTSRSASPEKSTVFCEEKSIFLLVCFFIEFWYEKCGKSKNGQRSVSFRRFKNEDKQLVRKLHRIGLTTFRTKQNPGPQTWWIYCPAKGIWKCSMWVRNPKISGETARWTLSCMERWMKHAQLPTSPRLSTVFPDRCPCCSSAHGMSKVVLLQSQIKWGPNLNRFYGSGPCKQEVATGHFFWVVAFPTSVAGWKQSFLQRCYYVTQRNRGKSK
jgi:hypothetical protein